MILPATDFVLPNEPCFELAEINRVLPVSGMGPRRIQSIVVIRNDERRVFERDLGEASGFKADEFVWPGAVQIGPDHWDVVETVARLQEAAEKYRTYFDKGTPRSEPPTDFKKAMEEYWTRKLDARLGRKQFSMVNPSLGSEGVRGKR